MQLVGMDVSHSLNFIECIYIYVYIYMNILLSPIFIVSEYFYYLQCLQSLTINQLLIKNSSILIRFSLELKFFR